MSAKRKIINDTVHNNNAVCFFMHSYVITKNDDVEREEVDWNRYVSDKCDSKCGFASFENRKTNKALIWDGKEEHDLDIIDESGTDLKLNEALIYLNSDVAKNEGCAIKYGYDYAWILVVIKNIYFVGQNKLNYKSTPDFVKHISSIGNEFGLKKRIVESETIDKYKNRVANRELPFVFNDHCGVTEANRRNNIASAFLSIMQRI